MSKTFNNTGMGRIIAWISARVFKKSEAVTTQVLGIDSTPTNNSTNLVTSGGVYNAISNSNDIVWLTYGINDWWMYMEDSDFAGAYTAASNALANGKLPYLKIVSDVGINSENYQIFAFVGSDVDTGDLYFCLTEPATYSYGITLHSDGSVDLYETSVVGHINCNNTTAQTVPTLAESLSRTINLHKVSKTGDYNDLLNKPTIPNITIDHYGAIDSTGEYLIKMISCDDGLMYAIGAGNADGEEDYVLATTDDIPNISTNVVTDKASNTKTSSPKSVYDEIHPAIVTTQPSGGFAPNVFYNLGTLTGSVTFSLASVNDANIVNHYYWTFDTSTTAPTITWPSGISWFGGNVPTIVASKHYEISILNNIGCFMEV